jgi:alkylhydroperoxidase/carboxymuconolactone decarboxylase family protein YurZ
MPPAPQAAGDIEIPDWLREEPARAAPVPATPSAATTEQTAPPEQPAEESGPPVPTVPAETTVPPVSAAPPAAEAPPPAPVAPAPAPAPGPEATAFDALGGPRQTPESITSAVQAAEGIDPRTRTLLLFGMALVRLAAPEARAAAEAARRAGLTTEDLRLVVEMAQALGGGPSERLGRRILEG